MSVSKWFVVPQARSQAKLRLFCLPFAGGSSAIFRRWPMELPESVEVWAVQLPGRGSRIKDPPYTQMQPLIRDLIEAIMPYLNQPYAIFGHSLGGLIGFELARQLRHQSKPLWLGVSAVNAPQLPDPNPQLHLIPEAELVATLKSYGGIPEGILDDPEMRQLFLPVIRSDFEVFETYTFQAGPVLACPISAFGGIKDVRIPDPTTLEAWQVQTTQSFKSHSFPGGHFFIQTHQSELLKALTQDLMPILADV